MFKSGPDTMRMEPSPERVFALARTVRQKESYGQEEFYRNICLTDVFGDSSKDIFRYTLNVAQELDLLEVHDGQVRLTVEPAVVDSYENFRRYAARKALSREGTLFFQTSSFILSKAEEIIKFTSWDSVVNFLHQQGLQVTENDLLGWRFWATFLGLGYFLQRNMLIPNLYTRIRDVLLEQNEFVDIEPIPADNFFLWLENQCPEMKACHEGTYLGLAVSNGLRTLQQQGEIRLISQPDALKWQLYRLDAEEINDLSHVQIAGLKR